MLHAVTLFLVVAAAPPQLIVVDAEGCLTREALIQRVAARLGQDPFVSESATKLTVTVVPDSSGATRSAVLTSSGSGARRFSGPTCESLTETVALALVLVIDPFGRREKPTPPAEVAPQPAPTPPPPVVVQVVTTPAPAAPHSEPVIETIDARLSGTLAPGLFPTLGPGVELRAQATAHIWSVAIDVTLMPPLSVPLQEGAVEAGGGWLGVLGCLHVSVFEGCLVGRVGLGWFQGQQLPDARGAPAILGTVGLRGGLVWPQKTRVYGAIAGELVLALKRVHLEVAGHEVWGSPPLSGRLTAGLGVRF
ncbi:MAG: hypothetical protein ACOZQL_20085 [Myxococcota bacterium]